MYTRPVGCSGKSEDELNNIGCHRLNKSLVNGAQYLNAETVQEVLSSEGYPPSKADIMKCKPGEKRNPVTLQ